MKKKILVTEEQLKYIINFIGSGEKPINEQITTKGKFKVSAGMKRSTLGSGSVIGGTTSNDIINSIDWINENKDTYEKLNKEFRPKLTKVSENSYWSKWMSTVNFLTSPEYKGNINFEDEKVREKYMGIYYIVNFLKLYSQYTDKKVKKIIISNKGEKTITPTIKKSLTDPINFTTKLQNSSEGKPFEDNLTQPTELVFNNLDQIISSLDTKLQEILSKNENLNTIYEKRPESFTWVCNDIMVASSASRYANTGDASNMNFITLSKERATNGYNTIKDYIVNKGIDLKEGFETNPESIQYVGDNNDGSSGPTPPKNNSMADLSFEGIVGGKPNYVKYKDPNYEKVYNESIKRYGQPYPNKLDYDKHKWFVFSVNFKLIVKEPPIPEPTKILKSYQVKFYTSKFDFDIQIPSISLDFSVPKRTKVFKTKIDACPGRGKKGWWTGLI